jgi:hypothetical protein
MRRSDRREVRRMVGGAFLDIGNYILRKDRRSMKGSELGKKLARRGAKITRIYTREFEEEGRRVVRRVARDGRKVVRSARKSAKTVTRGRLFTHA